MMQNDFDDFVDSVTEPYRLEYEDMAYYQYYEGGIGEWIEPTYDVDSMSLEFAKKLFHALNGRGVFTGYDNRDDRHAVYQPHNQTIFDPYELPDTPICPQTFLTRVTGELSSKGVFISNETPELLMGLCRTFNYSMNHGSELPRSVTNLVFPAQTGIGKSVSLQVYVSMLEKKSSLIVVAKVEEAINYCQNINQLSGNDDYARCYYAITDKNKDHPLRVDALALRDAQCIVITHNMFKRVNGFDSTDIFSLYQGQHRDFVVIDEKLAFYDQQQISYAELDRLINNVEVAVSQSPILQPLASSHMTLEVLKRFKAFLVYKDDKIITDSNSILIDEALDIDLAEELAELGETLIYSDEIKGYPKKIVGLKNKQAVYGRLKRLGVPTQAKKRNIIGVSNIDLLRDILSIVYDEIEPFYCKQLDPKLANCNPKPPPFEYELPPQYKDAFEDPVFWKKSKEHNDALDAFQAQHQLISDDTFTIALNLTRIILQTRVSELIEELSQLGARQNPSYRQSAINKIEEQLQVLRDLSMNHFLIYKSNMGNSAFSISNVTNKLGVCVVLDATAQFNEYYRLANRYLGYVGFVVAPLIRKYQNLTIHKAKGFNQSRSALYKQDMAVIKANANEYLSYAQAELEKKDKMLIVCHLDFKSELMKQNADPRIVFTHWGDHVGRNKWSDCNKVMLIGWNYLNPLDHVSGICSALDSVLLTTRYLDEELLDRYEISQLADDMVQAFMRSQARVIATANSDCKPTSFYFFYKDDAQSHQVVDLVERQFPEATIIDWIPKGNVTTKLRKREASADKVIKLLMDKAKSHQTYLLADVLAETGINKSTMNRVVTSDYFKERLTDLGFIYANRDGRSMQFILS